MNDFSPKSPYETTYVDPDGPKTPANQKLFVNHEALKPPSSQQKEQALQGLGEVLRHVCTVKCSPEQIADALEAAMGRDSPDYHALRRIMAPETRRGIGEYSPNQSR